jgi:hypothetical protein
MLVLQIEDSNSFICAEIDTVIQETLQQTANCIIYNIHSMTDLQIISKEEAALTANSFTNVIN